MITEVDIGAVRIRGVLEYHGPTHAPAATFPDFDRESFAAAAARLPAGNWVPGIDRLVIGIHVWVVFAGDRTIVIDTGVGNGKPRPVARMDRLNTLFPAWLEACGAGRDRVTDVVMTHLHTDHVGWNTLRAGDAWVPTFPRATHHLPRADFAFFEAEWRAGGAFDASFADSVAPLLQAVPVRFVDPGDMVAGVLRAEDAAGHSPGQLVYWLDRPEGSAVFAADILHHPLQILLPDWNTAACMNPDMARATRHRFLERLADTGTLVFPCHFPPPHAGRILRGPGGYGYAPIGAAVGTGGP